jgi:hypothetical protein
MLVQLYPHLIQILLLNIDSNIEAIRLAVLKTLEYLVDILGCSLENSLIHILVALLKTYPVTKLFDQETNDDFKSEMSARKVHSFF